MIAVVESVERLVRVEAGKVALRGEPYWSTPVIRRVCAQLSESVKPATYYKYRRLYQAWGGDRSQMVATLRRATFNQTRFFSLSDVSIG
jgi:hypothetical protein